MDSLPASVVSGQDKVAFLGPFSSYSHQATKSAFSGPEWELTPTQTIKEVFDIVQAGGAAYGVVPFENSTHGTVTFTLDGLADRADRYADIWVCAEIYLDVHHFLLGRKDASPSSSSSSSQDGSRVRGEPLTSLAHIKRVYSHPQAFGQTGAFFGRHLRGVETIDVSSTSKAAEMAAADASGTSAAVAGEIAAAANGLDVLAGCIEDREDNTTRFFVIRTKGPDAPPLPQRAEGGGGDDDDDDDDGSYGAKYKTLVSFTVPHRTPGALADVLDCFRRLGLNLTSINSLPCLVEPFSYLFFVEFEGSRLDDPKGRVSKALEGMGKVARSWRWLGSWRNQRKMGGEKGSE
ncbi:prephenate dehydratase [Bombardia bombarda]|uniref:prephenate dehydratase n=1 Tax=Bombardia bombarda TaxID=252184 RepID=A0AA40C1U9_9PEZI|nr:prephenate dehydratase [Bombardia bombarda]